jgi:hypothetical protein
MSIPPRQKRAGFALPQRSAASLQLRVLLSHLLHHQHPLFRTLVNHRGLLRHPYRLSQLCQLRLPRHGKQCPPSRRPKVLLHLNWMWIQMSCILLPRLSQTPKSLQHKSLQHRDRGLRLSLSENLLPHLPRRECLSLSVPDRLRLHRPRPPLLVVSLSAYKSRPKRNIARCRRLARSVVKNLPPTSHRLLKSQPLRRPTVSGVEASLQLLWRQKKMQPLSSPKTRHKKPMKTV